MIEYINKNYDMHKFKNYIDIKVGCNGTAEIVVPMDVAEPQFVLISNAVISKLKVDSLRVKLKKRGLRRDALKADLLKRLKQAMVEKTPL